MFLCPHCSSFSAGCVDIGDVGWNLHSSESMFLSMKQRICLTCLQGSTKAEDSEQYHSLGGWVGHKASLVQSCPLCLLVGQSNGEIFMLHIHVPVHGGLPAGFPVMDSPVKDGCTGNSPLKGN